MWDEIQDMPGEIFEVSLRDRCLAVAEAQAWEINGDIDRIDPADLESCLSRLTPGNLLETASEVAHLAAWVN
jgi:hypothetical protein